MNDNGQALILLNVEELKNIQLEILDAVTGFCEKHGINYWLDGGTLIGAVRHKGYIPWDDDIDISMLREDYDKFMRLFNAENERYKCHSYENDKDILYPLCKVLDTHTVLYEPDKTGNKLCVNIDIFPYDNVPDSRQAKKMYRRRNKYNVLVTAQRHSGRAKGSFVRRFAAWAIKVYVKIFPKDKFVKKTVINAKKFTGVKTEAVGDFMGCVAGFICNKDIFKEFIDSEFENKMYKIPKEYDKLLTLEYGDYMTPPPEAERVTHHKFEAYMKKDN